MEKRSTEKLLDSILSKYGKIKLSDLKPENTKKGEAFIASVSNLSDDELYKLSSLYYNQIEFNTPARPFSKIDNPTELAQYLEDEEKIKDTSEQYVSHYTNFENVTKMVTGKKLYLANPSKMNDGLEFSYPGMDCSKLYFSSFALEKAENLGMWSMYGQPWSDGIKISVPKKEFLDWAKKVAKVHLVDNTSCEVIAGSTISNGFSARTTRVAYVEQGSKGVEKIICGQAKNTSLKTLDRQILTGLIKDIAWSYEKEIRLRVDLDNTIPNNRIAIDIPESVLGRMIITTGPRFSNNVDKAVFSDVGAIQKSIFTGKLTRIYCDVCNKNAGNEKK
ncbi:MAG: hypothetical protein IJL03_07220 [Lachnospiraceae bacterium]|nr:hypothetical protein [Lachnospiraceae bacterium]